MYNIVLMGERDRTPHLDPAGGILPEIIEYVTSQHVVVDIRRHTEGGRFKGVSFRGKLEARKLGREFKDGEKHIQKAYTSRAPRASETAWSILRGAGQRRVKAEYQQILDQTAVFPQVKRERNIDPGQPIPRLTFYDTFQLLHNSAREKDERDEVRKIVLASYLNANKGPFESETVPANIVAAGVAEFILEHQHDWFNATQVGDEAYILMTTHEPIVAAALAYFTARDAVEALGGRIHNLDGFQLVMTRNPEGQITYKVRTREGIYDIDPNKLQELVTIRDKSL